MLKDHLPPPTDPDLLGILEELIKREPIFHRPELGTSRADFEKMTSPDFWEIGASGRRYNRPFALDELERRHSTAVVEDWKTSEFHCRKLAQDVFLLTYTLLEEGVRLTRRSTIWELTETGWQVAFHQGTIVEGTES
jgi:hypothetical protein